VGLQSLFSQANDRKRGETKGGQGFSVDLRLTRERPKNFDGRGGKEKTKSTVGAEESFNANAGGGKETQQGQRGEKERPVLEDLLKGKNGANPLVIRSRAGTKQKKKNMGTAKTKKQGDAEETVGRGTSPRIPDPAAGGGQPQKRGKKGEAKAKTAEGRMERAGPQN